MKKLLIALGCGAAGLALVTVATADEFERVRPVADELVRKECGACHMTFQPAFLPASSWQKLMAGLDDHFGENASLGEDTARRITDYLVANAGPERRFARDMKKAADGSLQPPLRISELGWFKAEHDHEVSPSMRQKARSMSNCSACHRGAEQGWYEDD